MTVPVVSRDATPRAPSPLSGARRRRPTLVGRMVALTLVVCGVGIVVSAGVELVDGGDETVPLLACGLVTAAVGVVGSRLTTPPDHVPAASVFAAVAWTWVAASVAGMVPFLATGVLDSWYDALFESISGFTCAGSTVLTAIDGQPQGLLFWRQLTQWLGGMGLIVLAVAVLPVLRVGGLELISAEAPGPDTDRLSPRISGTAKRLWLLYAGLTVTLAAVLVPAGMSPFDAVSYSFTTMSTGGFAPHDTSVAHFDSVVIEMILVVGMVIGGANFALHWRALLGNPGVYLRVSEMRLYASVLLGATGMVWLLRVGQEAAPTALREAVFNVVTVVTSCGFGTSDFTRWGPAPQLLLVLLMVPAGMTGSTSGGLKLLRMQVLFRHAAREMRRVRHRRAVVPVRLGRQVLGEDVVQKVLGFVVLYLTLVVVGGAAVTALGTDLTTGFSGAVSAMGNIGPALGEAGPASNFLVYPAPARAILMVLMLAGRLELFAVLFMFTAPLRRLRRRG